MRVREGLPGLGGPVQLLLLLTLRERLRLIGTGDGEGLMRFMLVESRREIEAEMRELEKRLEGRTQRVADAEDRRLLEFLAR